jgi:UDP-N-acetylmuramoylalanine--D-glutamate ligase
VKSGMSLAEFKNTRVLVVGLGKSGLAAAKLLKSGGARVFVSDDKPRRQLREALAALPRGIEAEAGGRRFFKRPVDLVVLSPGVPADAPAIRSFRRRGIPVWPELELAWRLVKPYKTAAITGTNGKTTTTALLGEILKKAGKHVVVGGNIGTPLSDLVHQVTSATYLVLEVSSYQLETHQTFHPNVGVILNVTPDHLARHRTMKKYAEAKGRLFDLFSGDDTAVLNSGDRWCRRLAPRVKGRIAWFPSRDLETMARYVTLPGEHNRANAMAAVASARALGLKDRQIKKGLLSFKGVPHRLQIVADRGGVLYVNDSKATNVDSTLVALRSIDRPLILIMGGQHKGSPYSPLVPALKKKARMVLTIGEAAGRIRGDIKGAVPVKACGTLKNAVRLAAREARPGETVLLSPACASFDQFKNFEDRGERFARLAESAGAAAR